MRGFYQYATAYTTCQPDIMKWYQSYIQQQCFVCDLVHGVVCTFIGNIVYPALELPVHRLVSIQPTSRFAVTNAAATVYTDIDSVVCTYCSKTRSADFCWKRSKDDASSVGELWQLYITGADHSAHLFCEKAEAKEKLHSLVNKFASVKDFELLKMGKLSGSSNQKKSKLKIAVRRRSRC